MNEVPDGTVGHLAVRGPTGCRYLADDRQTKYVRDGWNLTGDDFVRDADGVFHFVARADDMIISSGYNIAGPEVEAALLSHADVAECAVVGAPDAERGQIVQAHVVLKEGVDGDEACVKRLQDHVKATIAPYKYPRSVKFVSALPKTQTGKIQRFKLKPQSLITGGRDAVPSPEELEAPVRLLERRRRGGPQIFVAGQVGWNARQEFASDDFVAQVEQALLNIVEVLAEADARPEHIVRLTWYVTDKREYLARSSEVGQVYRRVIGRHFPAMTLVQVAALVEDRARVEIEATAVCKSRSLKSEV